MNLRHYIEGPRRGKEAHRIERNAMNDPFLAEALEGYDKIEGKQVKRISDMRRHIVRKTQRRHYRIRNFSIAASLLVLLGFGSYFLSYINRGSAPQEALIAKSETPVPEENERPAEIIAQEEQTIAQASSFATRSAAPLLLSETAKKEETVKNEEKSFLEYVEKNRRPLTNEVGKEIKGTVTLSFLVNEQGLPHSIKVKKTLCEPADNEAIRLLREGPRWTPTENEKEISLSF